MKLTYIAAATTLVGLLGVGIPAAQADTGDSNPGACNTYEICFSKDADNVRYQRQFFYDDHDHGGNHYYDRSLGSWTGISLEDSADQIKNCDGSHYVRVVDWNGVLPSTTWDAANSCNWLTLGSNVRNQNNEHYRL